MEADGACAAARATPGANRRNGESPRPGGRLAVPCASRATQPSRSAWTILRCAESYRLLNHGNATHELARVEISFAQANSLPVVPEAKYTDGHEQRRTYDDFLSARGIPGSGLT